MSEENERNNDIRVEVVARGKFDKIEHSLDFIEGMLCENSVAFIYGPPGCGKTFFAIHLLCCAATGRQAFALDVKQREALYVGLEGEASIKARIQAWMIENGVKSNPIYYALGSMNLITEGAQAELVRIMREHGIKVIAIDTLSMAATGIDENSAEHMTLVVSALHNIKRETGACVIAIAHTGKNERAGIRGHSSQRGNVDTIIEIETLNAKARKGKRGEPDSIEEPVTLSTERRATVRKQRDGADGARVQFRLTAHETPWRNARGNPVTSVAVSECEFRDLDAEEAVESGPQPRRLTSREKEALHILARQSRIEPPTVEQFQRALKRAHWGPENPSSWRSAFQRLLDKLSIDSNGEIEHVH